MSNFQRLPIPTIEFVARTICARPPTAPTTLRRLWRREIGTVALDASKGDRERVVILGSGWAGTFSSTSLPAKSSIDRAMRNIRVWAVPKARCEEVPSLGRITPIVLRLHSSAELDRSRHARIPHRARTDPQETLSGRLLSGLGEGGRLCKQDGQVGGKPDRANSYQFECREHTLGSQRKRGGSQTVGED